MEELKLKKQQKNLEEINKFFEMGLYDTDSVGAEDLIEVFGSVEKGKRFVKFFNIKIDRLSELYGWDKNEVLVNAIHNKMFRELAFSMDANKQNIYEKSQRERMNDIIKIINSINKETYKFMINDCDFGERYSIKSNGALVMDRKKVDYFDQSKLFDFVIDGTKHDKPYKIFFFNKYTNGHGGAQDCTKIETIRTMQFCNKNRNENVFFVFMLDGDYWKSFEAKDIDKRKILLTNTKNVCEDIVKFMLNV